MSNVDERNTGRDMCKGIIIAISGRKLAGKNTIAKFIDKYCQEKFNCLPALECSFADALKEFCIDVLGLKYEQCYGTNEEKNTPTEYSWENVEPYLRWKFGSRQFLLYDKAIYDESIQNAESYYAAVSDYYADLQPVDLKFGYMSGRDVMQIFGTDLIRETFGNVWASATIRKIKKHNKFLSLITDNRFPNEVEKVLAEPQGHIIRLTRSPYGTSDLHPSESSLDGFNWNRDRCFVVDNANLTINDQNELVKPIIDSIFYND